MTTAVIVGHVARVVVGFVIGWVAYRLGHYHGMRDAVRFSFADERERQVAAAIDRGIARGILGDR